MAAAQQQKPAPLVLDSVTVVDVEQGKLVPDQRVVIAGNRIQTIDRADAVKLPKGTRIVAAKGKYLIPGLWDMHTHAGVWCDIFYALFLANGVTGIRDASSSVPLDTLRLWRQAILAGTMVGPPRQLLSGAAIHMRGEADCKRPRLVGHVCLSETDSTDPRRLVAELKAAGADMIKTYTMTPKAYFAVIAEARRVGLLVGGHGLTVSHLADCDAMGGYTPECVRYYTEQASDSGVGILDHSPWYQGESGGLQALCWGDSADFELCRPLAERLRRNGTWFAPTLIALANIGLPLGDGADAVMQRFKQYFEKYWMDTTSNGRPPAGIDDGSADSPEPQRGSGADSLGNMYMFQRVGLPIVAATDVVGPVGPVFLPGPGFSLHTELAMYVAEGMTPLSALQTATLNPAKFLHATDSLGTVAVGKLADLVLLDANPLANITNTTKIRAVVANGRYFDRAALDGLLIEARAKARRQP